MTNQSFALGGNDTVLGGNNNDLILAGAGQDDIYGGNNAVRTTSDASDDDVIFGDIGSVTLVTGVVTAAFSQDTNIGDVDTIYGNEGSDIIIAGAGNDVINSGAGNDWVLGDFGTVELRSTETVIESVSGEQHAFGNDTIHPQVVMIASSPA
ncbi:calcium-binding protein [Vibrio taketomensis]|uniref:calcium-binding protein n=1 Tax=Vibrio taketomensis TaxID=2572923 RepID=UPI0013898C88|nr:hypothetical protein [Vibrio taketomensis]